MTEKTLPDAVELRIAEHLLRALLAFAQAEHLTSQDVVEGSAEFLTQVCVMALAAARAQGAGLPLAQLADAVDDLTGAIATTTLKRLQWRWTP